MKHDLLICSAFCLLFSSAVGQDLPETIVVSDDRPPLATQPRATKSQQAIRQQEAVPAVESRSNQPLLISDVFDPTIDQGAIQDRQYQDLTDVLARTPGVSLIQSGNKGATASLFIRGAESNHAPVLLDGRRLPAGLAGLYQIEYLGISTLESVQISKGAVSSLYGGDAVAGVIDLRSTDARAVEEDLIESTVELGSFSTFTQSNKLQIREGKLGVALSNYYTDTDNDRPNSAYTNENYRANIAYSINEELDFDFLAYIQESSVGVPGNENGSSFPESQINDNESLLLSPRLRWQHGDWEVSTFYSYTENELVATDAPFFSDNSLQQTGHEFEAVASFRPSDEQSYLVGVAAYQYDFERQPLSPFSLSGPSAFRYDYVSVFAQAENQWANGWKTRVSARHDFHNQFEDATTVSAEIRVPVGQAEVFTKFATGYKPPSGQDYVFLSPQIDPGTLTPEESTTWEIGFQTPFANERGRFGATFFANEFDNLVDSSFNFLTFETLATVVDTESHGWEIALSYDFTETVSGYANYTYLDAKIRDGLYFGGFSGQAGDRLIRRPRHSFQAGLAAKFDRGNVGIELTSASNRLDSMSSFSGPGFVDDYELVRLYGTYELTERIDVFARVENALNQSYETTSGFTGAGQSFHLGARILWGD